jgi:integrase
LHKKGQKEGECAISICVTYQRQKKYYPAGIDLTAKSFDRIMTAKRRSEADKATYNKIHAAESKASNIAEKLHPFTFERFEKLYVENREAAGTLAAAFDNYIAELRSQDRISTAVFYTCSKVSIENFKERMLLSHVTVKFIKEYETWMTGRGRSTTSIGMYLRALRAIIKRAIKDDDFDQPYPFANYEIPTGAGNKRWLSDDDIYRLYNYTGVFQRAKDFWFFSFFGCGMNFKDIVNLKYSNIDLDKNVVSYYRSKTIWTKKKKEKIQIDYTEDMKRIVEEYGTGKDGENFVFPILQKGITPEREMQLKDQFIHVINNDLKEIAKELKIKPFSTYSCRHSWATVQQNEGLNVGAISKMLGHANSSTTAAYLGSLNVKTIRQATENANAFKKQKPATGKVVPMGEVG